VPSAPWVMKPLWTHPMVLLGKGAQVKAWFVLFGDRAILDRRYYARFAWNIPYA